VFSERHSFDELTNVAVVNRSVGEFVSVECDTSVGAGHPDADFVHDAGDATCNSDNMAHSAAADRSWADGTGRRDPPLLGFGASPATGRASFEVLGGGSGRCHDCARISNGHREQRHESSIPPQAGQKCTGPTLAERCGLYGFNSGVSAWGFSGFLRLTASAALVVTDFVVSTVLLTTTSPTLPMESRRVAYL